MSAILQKFKLQSLFWQLAIPMIYVAIIGFLITIYSASSLKDSFVAIGEFHNISHLNVDKLEALDKSIISFRTLSLKHLTSENAAEMVVLKLELKRHSDRIRQQTAMLYKDFESSNNQYLSRVGELKKNGDNYLEKINQAILESEDFEKELAFVTWTDAENNFVPGINQTIKFFIFREFKKLINGSELTMSATNQNLVVTLGIGFCAGIVLLLLAFFVMRRISRRLLNLLQWSKKFSEGDLSVNLDLGANDEVGQLSRSMDAMAKKINHTHHQLEEAKICAEQANNAKSLFLANISHELRTPLHGILSYSKLGQTRITKVSRDKLQQFFTNIQISGDRLLNLVNDLLDISTLEAGKLEIHKSEEDLAQILNSCKMELLAKLEDHKLKLQIDIPEHNETILCDGERITQVIINLLSNAIKFSPPEGVIGIKYEFLKIDYKSHVKVSVSDQGTGIPAVEHQEIFQMFSQSSKQLGTSGMRSTGLGLAICQEIINLHGGSIKIEDTPNASPENNGSVFSFVIPVW